MKMDSLIAVILFGGQMNTLSQIFRVLLAMFFGYAATNYAERQLPKNFFWLLSFCYLYLALCVEFINSFEYFMG